MVAFALRSLIQAYQSTDQAAQILRPAFESTLLACQMAERIVDKYTLKVGISLVPAAAPAMSGFRVYQPGERDAAMTALRGWVEARASAPVILCDPYFSTDDLYLVEWLQASPATDLTVLTGCEKNDVKADLEGLYRVAWEQLSAAQIDATILVIFARNSKRTPLHDRWIICGDAGLKLGTSLNGFGHKISEISEMDREEVTRVSAILEPYVTMKAREFGDERLDYKVVML